MDSNNHGNRIKEDDVQKIKFLLRFDFGGGWEMGSGCSNFTET